MKRASAEGRAPFPADHLGVLAAGVLLMVVGWGGLLVLVRTQDPFIGQRWLFLLLLQIAAAGTVLPLMRYLNARLTPRGRRLPPGGVIVRQSVWVGLFAAACAWLQIPRVLSPAIMFFLALAFVIVEIFLRSRELPGERSAANGA
ncbi:MAG: hypothetical protein SGJ24_01170 [Chloroflexota bacterium]|nr:hypothetical protein [Chloroflexota bacterium]